MSTSDGDDLPCETKSCQDLEKLTYSYWWWVLIIIVYVGLLVVGWIYFAKLNKLKGSNHDSKWSMSLAFAILGTVLFPLFNIGPPIIWANA